LKHFYILLALFFGITSNTKAQDPRRPEKACVQFDNQTLILAFEGNDPSHPIKEFIPAGENINSWTKLASIQEYPEALDPKTFASTMVRVLKAQNPQSRNRVIENSETGEVLLDFITWPENCEYVEFNIFKFAKKKGRGVIAFQYALRKYGDSTAFLTDLKGTRIRLVNMMATDGFKITE